MLPPTPRRPGRRALRRGPRVPFENSLPRNSDTIRAVHLVEDLSPGLFELAEHAAEDTLSPLECASAPVADAIAKEMRLLSVTKIREVQSGTLSKLGQMIEPTRDDRLKRGIPEL